jgi:hypothetical protein
MIPSVAVKNATELSLPDPTRGARFFGFDFTCGRALNAPDRRLLRTAAQLLSIVNSAADGTSHAERPLDFKPRQDKSSRVIAYNVADWLEMCDTDGYVPHQTPWQRSA